MSDKLINPIIVDNKPPVNPIVVDTKDPEKKEYLLLWVGLDNDEDGIRDFEFIIGRTATYERIKSLIQDIDIDNSYVLVEGVALEDRISVYAFMKHMHLHFYQDDLFDIEAYNQGDEFEITEDGTLEITSFNNKDYI